MKKVLCDICEKEIKVDGATGYNDYPTMLSSVKIAVGDVTLYLGPVKHVDMPDVCRECWDREMAKDLLFMKVYDHRNKQNQDDELFKRCKS